MMLSVEQHPYLDYEPIIINTSKIASDMQKNVALFGTLIRLEALQGLFSLRPCDLLRVLLQDSFTFSLNFSKRSRHDIRIPQSYSKTVYNQFVVSLLPFASAYPFHYKVCAVN